MKYSSIYVAATSQHVGKTTSTLGLVSAFIKKGINVGYSKPVGQRFVDVQNLKVDKDALLFSTVMHFELNSEIHSPVILGSGATAAYLDDPQGFDYENKIIHAAAYMEENYDIVVYEGTGHPGVGSIVDLSNADVAKLVNAGVVMVVEGGIGSTIDMLSLCLAKFQQKNVPIIGVIINKTLEDKIDKVKHYVGIKLKEYGIPLLGVIPYDKSLAYPTMKSVIEATRGVVEYNEDMLDNKVEDILAGSLIDLNELKSSKDLLLVVSALRVDAAIQKIKLISRMFHLKESPLSGIVATGLGEISEDSIAYVQEHNIPFVRTSLDTYGSVVKISKIEVKINQRTPWKVDRAIELIEQNIDLDYILTQTKKQ
ncbi:MAG: AAA family ATPase [Saprospiraceae bacterium]|nr:AAA family ATPase [Saprospiraceae bacterium]